MKSESKEFRENTCHHYSWNGIVSLSRRKSKDWGWSDGGCGCCSDGGTITTAEEARSICKDLLANSAEQREAVERMAKEFGIYNEVFFGD